MIFFQVDECVVVIIFGTSANLLLKTFCFLLRVLRVESRIPPLGIESAFCKHKMRKILTDKLQS